MANILLIRNYLRRPLSGHGEQPRKADGKFDTEAGSVRTISEWLNKK